VRAFFNRLRYSLFPCLAVFVLAALVRNGPAFCGEIHVAAEKGDLESVNSLLKENPGLVFSKGGKGG
jgi:hypothetical protein